MLIITIVDLRLAKNTFIKQIKIILSTFLNAKKEENLVEHIFSIA